MLCGCELCWADELFGWLKRFVSEVVELPVLLLGLDPVLVGAGELLALPGVLEAALPLLLLLLVVESDELDALVSVMLELLRLLFIAEPLCREAAEPVAVPLLSGVELISPVSLRAQPAKTIKLAAKSAYFFIDIPRIFPGCLEPRITPEPGSPLRRSVRQ